MDGRHTTLRPAARAAWPLIGLLLAACSTGTPPPATASTATGGTTAASPTGGTTTAAPSQPRDDRAGHDVAKLTIVTGEADAGEAHAFADAVAAASNGTITLTVDNATIQRDADYETRVVERVRSGAAELGFAAARVFDTLGVKAFTPLHAPFLIDHYALEDHVLSSPMATALLSETRPAGVVGVGYIQGPLRFPLGYTRDLMSPSDYAGARIGIRKSSMTERSLAALGASSVVFEPGNTDGLDGMEVHVGLLLDNYDHGSPSLAGNVPLWPRPGIIFANAAVWDGLSPAQQAILRDAGVRALRDTVRTIAENAVLDVVQACENGLRINQVPDASREALRTAVQPIYDELNADVGTRATLAAVQAMRDSEPAPADAVVCPAPAISPAPSTPATPSPSSTATASTSDVSPLDGTWYTCFDRQELLAAGIIAGEDQPDAGGCFYLTFRDGKFYQRRQGEPLDPEHPQGPFTVDGDELAISSSLDPEPWQYRWSIFDDNLTLKRTKVPAPTGLMVKPWKRGADPEE